MKIVYVASLLRYDGVEHVGRSLARHLRTEHELNVCGAIVRQGSELLQGRVRERVMSAEELDEIDVIYMEGGWTDGSGSATERFPLEMAESFVRRGGQLVVADVGHDEAQTQRQSLAVATNLFGASVSIGEVHGHEGVRYLHDESARERGYGTWFFPSQMYVSEWLKPTFEGIDSILADGVIQLQPVGADIAASGNIPSTGVLVKDLFVDQGGLFPWASVKEYGLGHATLIGAHVSGDIFVEKCPDNARWISNLIALLADRTRETRGWVGGMSAKSKGGAGLNLHTLVSDASGTQFANGHYDEAVFAALRAIEHRVQTLTGSADSVRR